MSEAIPKDEIIEVSPASIVIPEKPENKPATAEIEIAPPPPEDLPTTDSIELPKIEDQNKEKKPKSEEIEIKTEHTLKKRFFEGANTVVDRVKAWHNYKRFREHDENVARLHGVFIVAESTLERLEHEREQIFEEHKEADVRFGKTTDKKELVAYHDVRVIEDKIKNAKLQRNTLEHSLKQEDDKKSVYENKVKGIIERFANRIQNRLEPLEKQTEVMQEHLAEIDKEEQNFRADIENASQEISRLERQKATAISGRMKLEIEGMIGKFREMQKDAEGNMRIQGKERARLDGELSVIGGKVLPWRINQEKLGFYTQHVMLEKSAVHESREQEWSRETVKDILPNDYIKAWNKYFGSTRKIRDEEIHSIFKNQAEIPMEPQLLEVFMSKYLKGAGLKERDIASKLRSLDMYISYHEK